LAQHVRILAWLFVAFGALLLVGGLLCAFFLVGGGLLSGDREAMLITSGLAVFLAGLFIALSIPSFIAGWGLLRFRPWARVLAIILGVLNILSFPFGTALAIYTLWVLLNDETQSLFGQPVAVAAH
jgi:hypothetical protein